MNIRSTIDFYDNRFLMFVIDQMANDLEKNDIEVIRMTLGKSELTLNESIIDSMKDALSDYKKYSLVYPAGLPALKEKLSAFYKDVYHVHVDPMNIIISVGTSTIFRNLFYLLVQKGDEVLLPYPYYSLYKFSALLSGATIKYYTIDLNSLEIDMKSFHRNYSDKTKVVVINTPGNPLGNIVSKDTLIEIDKIINGQSVIINDEIYATFCFTPNFTSILQLSDIKSKYIVTNSFSKGFRMYSRRVGYCIVPNEFVTPLTTIQHHTLLTTDPVVQFGAITALDHLDDVNKLRELYQERRDYTVESFKNVKNVKPYYSQGGFYITLNCEEFIKLKNIESSFDLAKDILEKKCVATVPGMDFGLPYTLRLSFSSDKYQEGIDRLIEYFIP